jgi:hypothetical protein
MRHPRVCVVFFSSTNTILQYQNILKRPQRWVSVSLNSSRWWEIASISSPFIVSKPMAFHSRLLFYVRNAKRHSGLYIVGCSFVAFAILACFDNIPAIDAFFFAVSSCTESGLNPIDVKELKLGQQLVIYIFPIITNLAFVNIGVVLVRLRYFEKRLRKIDPRLLTKRRPAEPIEDDTENHVELQGGIQRGATRTTTTSVKNSPNESKMPEVTASHPKQNDHIAWANDVGRGNALRIPSPRELDQGESLSICVLGEGWQLTEVLQALPSPSCRPTATVFLSTVAPSHTQLEDP